MHAKTRKPIVVGVDRSDPGLAAVQFAAELASSRQAPLRVLHAFEPSQYAARAPIGGTLNIEGVLRNSAQRLIDNVIDVLAAVHPNLEVVAVLEAGSATELLLTESEQADAVVLGSRGIGGFADLVLGSTTLHVASHASCPVIAVPAPINHATPPSGVAVGVDVSHVSEGAIRFGFEVAAATGQTLTAIHVRHDATRTGVGLMMPLAYDLEEVIQDERQMLAESLAGWQEKFPGVTVQQLVVPGHPISVLAASAAESQLLVVGSRGRGSIRSLVLGSVSHGVLHHTTRPVAVVRD